MRGQKVRGGRESCGSELHQEEGVGSSWQGSELGSGTATAAGRRRLAQVQVQELEEG